MSLAKRIRTGGRAAAAAEAAVIVWFRRYL
jgi:hypothetical protein